MADVDFIRACAIGDVTRALRHFDRPTFDPNALSTLGDVPLSAASGRAIEHNLNGLHQAVEKNRGALVAELLKRNRVDPNAFTSAGYTALHLAARKGTAEAVAALLARPDKVDVNAVSASKGMTALMYAARAGHSRIVLALLGNSRVDRSMVDSTGNSAIHYACLLEAGASLATKAEKLTIIQHLVSTAGAGDLRAVNSSGDIAFAVAVKSGFFDAVYLMLNWPTLDNEALDEARVALQATFRVPVPENYVSALMEAADLGDKETFARMLDYRLVDPRRVDDEGNTCFHYACRVAPETSTSARSGKLEIIRPFVTGRLNLAHQPNNHFNTGFMLAVKSNFAEAVLAMLSASDDRLGYNFSNREEGQPEMTPLTLAAREGFGAIARAMLRNPMVNHNLTDSEGNTVFHRACQLAPSTTPDAREGKLVIIRDLINNRSLVDLNARNNAENHNGDTGFLIAAKSDFCEAVELMLDSPGSGIRYNEADRNGRTAFAAACSMGHTDLVLDLLLERTDDLAQNQADANGRNALALAVLTNRFEIVKELLHIRNVERLNICLADHHGDTPFHHACRTGSVEMVREFLTRLDVVVVDEKAVRLATPECRKWIEKECRLRRDLLEQLRLAPHLISEDTTGDALGHGAFGRVLRGTLLGGKHRGQRVAIKLQLPGRDQTRDRDFHRELAIWAAVGRKPHPDFNTHPNILPLLAYSENPNKFVCPIAEHEDMWRFTWKLQDFRQYWDHVAPILLGAARGLDYLHRACNVVHGDLKPNNILIGKGRDKAYEAMIADFGLAKLRSWNDSTMPSVSPVVQEGTARFMAIEYVQGWRFRGTATKRKMFDVWAFGMICYVAALPGCEPFKTQDARLAKDIIAQGVRPRRPETAPNWLWTIVELCLEPQPENRPTFETIVNWLDDAIRNGAARGPLR